MTGCSKSISLDESGVIIYDLYLRGNISKLKDLGINSEELDSIEEEYSKVFKEGIMEEFNNAQFYDFKLNISDEQVESIITALRNAVNKLDCNVEVISKERNTAEIKIITNYIEYNDILKEAMEITANEFMDENFLNNIDYIDSDKFINDFMEACLNKIVEILNTYEATIATRSIKHTFKREYMYGDNNKKIKLWVPEDEEELADKLPALILGM